MFATMNDISWDGTVDSVSTRKPSRFENDEFIKAKAEPWVCNIGMYPDPLTSAAVVGQTAQQAAAAAAAAAQGWTANIEQGLQTAQMIASLAQTVMKWDEAEATKRQWESRNSAEFAEKGYQRTNELNNAKKQLDLSLENIGLDKKDIGFGKDKVNLGDDRLDIREDQLALDDQQFDIASAAAGTERAGVGALEQAEEEAAGIAGTGVSGVENYLNSLGARAGDYEAESKAFTDPLLAAAPGTTVGGSRYGGDFTAASGAEAYARDSRKSDIADFAAAMGESTNSLANIDIGQSGLGAQQDKISREMGLAGADQSLAAAGLRNEGVKLGGDEIDIDRKGLNIDMSSLGVDSARTNLNQQLKHSQYDDVFHKLGTQGRLDRVAQAYPKTLHGQQSVMFPAAQMLGQGSRLAGQFKPAQTQIKPQATSNFGSMSYGPPRGTSGLGWQGR